MFWYILIIVAMFLYLCYRYNEDIKEYQRQIDHYEDVLKRYNELFKKEEK